MISINYGNREIKNNSFAWLLNEGDKRLYIGNFGWLLRE